MNEKEIRDYILSFQVGERVQETDKGSCLRGRQGTTYKDKNGIMCILWDKLEGEDGQMGTSFTGGARRVSEL